MRFLYFFVSSGLLIGLVLLIRALFYKKLAPGVIYALWLVPLLRLLIPFGAWELPVFGTAANILNAPYAVFTEWEQKETFPAAVSLDSENENPITQTQDAGVSKGAKVYDAVDSRTEGLLQEQADSVEALQKSDKNSDTRLYGRILQGIWLAGSILLGCYVIYRNYQLSKRADSLETISNAGGLPVSVGSQVKVPCLTGFVHPRILMPDEIFKDQQLYERALRHELAHYRHKDHIWTAVKIMMCVIYWWHPLVWLAAMCMEEDAELACDARVLKGKSAEERRAYGYAILGILQNAEKKSTILYGATSMSGNQKSIKRRIKEISSEGTSTKKRVMLPVALVLVLALVFGCGIPTAKSWIKIGEWYEEQNEEYDVLETECEFALQDNIKSRLFYYEVYEYGQLTNRKIMTYEDLEDSRREALKLRRENSAEDCTLAFEHGSVMIECEMEIPKAPRERGEGSELWNDGKELLVYPKDDLVLMADFYPEEDENVTVHSCGELTSLSEEELSETLKDNYLTVLVRMVLSDVPGEQLYDTQVQRGYPVIGEINDGRTLAEYWAAAFRDRNAEGLKQVASEDCLKQLIAEGLMEEDASYFGWSSPWPWLTEQPYQILESDDSGAEIMYYAAVSTPHVDIWRETLKFEEVNGKLLVVSENLHIFDRIDNAGDFYLAYPEGKITETMMDYASNGLGEALNKNALETPDIWDYQVLFEPQQAAAYLLNLSTDAESVSYSLEDSAGSTTVQIEFLNNEVIEDVVEVTMWQPYGTDGIWIPK